MHLVPAVPDLGRLRPPVGPGQECVVPVIAGTALWPPILCVLARRGWGQFLALAAGSRLAPIAHARRGARYSLRPPGRFRGRRGKTLKSRRPIDLLGEVPKVLANLLDNCFRPETGLVGLLTLVIPQP